MAKKAVAELGDVVWIKAEVTYLLPSGLGC